MAERTSALEELASDFVSGIRAAVVDSAALCPFAGSGIACLETLINLFSRFAWQFLYGLFFARVECRIGVEFLLNLRRERVRIDDLLSTFGRRNVEGVGLL